MLKAEMSGIHNVSNKGSNDARGSLEETKTEISEMLYGGPWIDQKLTDIPEEHIGFAVLEVNDLFTVVH